MIEDAIKKYYIKLDELWLNRRKTHPMIPFVDKIEPFHMYVGEKNKSGYISWILQKNTESIDFSNFESVIGSPLSEELKQYFTSYWFLKMTGNFNDIKVSLTPITPLVDISVFISERLKIAKKQNRSTEKIEIGMAEIDNDDGYLLFYDNLYGSVEAFDPDKKEYKPVTSSLEFLISEMEPRC